MVLIVPLRTPYTYMVITLIWRYGIHMIVQWLALLVLLSWCVTALMGILVIRYRRPERAWAWLAVMFGLPVVGPVLYVLFGGQILTLRRRRRYSRDLRPDHKREERRDFSVYESEPDLPDYLADTPAQVKAAGDYGPMGGNTLSVTHDHSEIVSRLIRDIDTASHHVHLTFYIFMDDRIGRRIAQALTDAAQRGVQCRVLLDSVGSGAAFHRLVPQIEKAGVEVRAAFPANPFRSRLKRFDLRNHRKICIIDGRIAHIGSCNVGEPALPPPNRRPRYDIMMRSEGPLALQLQTLFLADWEFEGPELEHQEDYFPEMGGAGSAIAQTVPTDPLVDTAPVRDTAQYLFSHARHGITLITPYFIPDEPLEVSLCQAARRGVDVRVVIPARSDLRFVDAATRSYCRVCRDAGARIYSFQPGFLHAKMLLVDDAVAMIGSANFDNRSFRLNLETNAVIYDRTCVEEVKQIQNHYISQSELVSEPSAGYPRMRHMAEDLARLFSPLL